MKTNFDELDLYRSGPDSLGGRYLRRFWHPVYRSQDLRAGEAKPVRILNEDFTLYRGETGTAHAVGHRCAHRGTLMSTGFVEGDCIRCFYHGWMYAANGDCVERPGETSEPSIPIRIRNYPTEEYLGLVFVYFGEGEAPPLPRYRTMEAEGILDITSDPMPINYFYSMENDAFHFAFAHRDLLKDKGLSGVPKIWAEENDWGITIYDEWPGRNVGVTYKGLPNIGYIVPIAILLAKGQKYALHVSWRVPVDDEHHQTFRANLMPVTGEDAKRILDSRGANFYDRTVIPKFGDAVLAGEIRLDDIKDRIHIEAIQDYVAQVGQGPLETRRHERLGRCDAATVVWRRIWKREVLALAEGGALKEWKFTDEIAMPQPFV
jgi:5,5'-dehydrodivanillate O-demethylase oxygenase subunit